MPVLRHGCGSRSVLVINAAICRTVLVVVLVPVAVVFLRVIQRMYTQCKITYLVYRFQTKMP